MSVDSCEKRSADAVYIVLFEWDMVWGSGVSVFLGETEIDDVDEMRGSTGAHDKVGGLDVAVDVVLRVYEFDTGYLMNEIKSNSLGCYEKDRLTSWSASSKTVLSEKFRLYILNKSSREGPMRSMIITL